MWTINDSFAAWTLIKSDETGQFNATESTFETINVGKHMLSTDSLWFLGKVTQGRMMRFHQLMILLSFSHGHFENVNDFYWCLSKLFPNICVQMLSHHLDLLHLIQKRRISIKTRSQTISENNEMLSGPEQLSEWRTYCHRKIHSYLDSNLMTKLGATKHTISLQWSNTKCGSIEAFFFRSTHNQLHLDLSISTNGIQFESCA